MQGCREDRPADLGSDGVGWDKLDAHPGLAGQDPRRGKGCGYSIKSREGEPSSIQGSDVFQSVQLVGSCLSWGLGPLHMCVCGGGPLGRPQHHKQHMAITSGAACN